VIGFLDDYDKVQEAQPQGRVGRVRLLLEFVVAGRRLADRRARSTPTSTFPSCRRRYRPLGPFYIVFAAFVIVGFGNAVNLTDGLDGLATMPVIIAAGTFAIIAYLVGRVDYAPISASRMCRARANWRSSARDHGRGAGLPVVQRAARGGVHGRHRQPGARRRARRRSRSPPPRVVLVVVGGLFVLEAVASSSRSSGSSAPASGLPHGADPPPLRAARLERIDKS
jgi:phospho-N-acetylmuramoyl-pentapeptide-transferase